MVAETGDQERSMPQFIEIFIRHGKYRLAVKFVLPSQRDEINRFQVRPIEYLVNRCKARIEGIFLNCAGQYQTCEAA